MAIHTYPPPPTPKEQTFWKFLKTNSDKGMNALYKKLTLKKPGLNLNSGGSMVYIEQQNLSTIKHAAKFELQKLSH